MNSDSNPNDLLVIKTARDKNSINIAAKQGFRPLVQRVQPSELIRRKYAILQHQETGEIEVIGDYRDKLSEHSEYEKVIDWTYYYPDYFETPYAAYLIPENLKAGQKVWIEDLIKDYVGSHWNQGSNDRLRSCEALWTGKELEILYDASSDVDIFIG